MVIDRCKKNRKQSFGFIVALVFIISLSIFISRVVNVSALSTNYSKAASASLSTAEWNNLPNDFLAKSGDANGVMSGALNLSTNRITSVTDPSNSDDIATKNYVDTSISSVAGGAVFTNWGRNDCPTGTDKLYDGFGFGSEYGDQGGGNELVCLQSGGAVTTFSASEHSLVQPLITVNWAASFPTGFPIGKFIRCAVCYNSGSSCYVKTNSWSCGGAYSPVYTGYLGGAIRTAGPNYTTRDRSCLNKDLDGTAVPVTTPLSSKAIVQGTKIDANLGLSAYTTGRFTLCAVCCN